LRKDVPVDRGHFVTIGAERRSQRLHQWVSVPDTVVATLGCCGFADPALRDVAGQPQHKGSAK